MIYKLTTIIAIILTLISCSSEETTSDNATQAESAAIASNVTGVAIYINNGSGGTNHMFYSNEAELFQPYLSIVSETNAPAYKCGYTGEMIYEYRDGKKMSLEFNLQEGCNHIVYMQGSELKSKVLTEEGRLLLLSLMEKGETIHTQIEAPIEPMESLIDIEKLTQPLMARLKEYDQKEIFEGNGPDETIVNHVKFKPNENSENYIMVQVILKSGEVIRDEFAYYYPDADGNFIDSQYFVVDQLERPCDVCDIIAIETPKDKDPIGTFRDRSTGKEFNLTMGYNLEENYFYWFKE